ncbi:GGDEF domain-containing protein [uncultured Ferrimonas sp.]|uniref:GGDEF domain-containing protein n=1 Tax=uncultured Ferrimonas sp. TaxID=432640 RepID=UPI00262A9145|nr:GGDEF domain-containing protein [uncultured Ferrimonas sp.]
MTLRSLSIAAAIGTMLSLLVAYLLLRFGVFLPYAERQVLLTQNQELSRLHDNLSLWQRELEQQNRDWVLSASVLADAQGQRRLLRSPVVDAIYQYDNSLVLQWHSAQPGLADTLLDQDEGYARARLMPVRHAQQPRWRHGWLNLHGQLYGYSSGTLCRSQLERCDSGFLLLLRQFTQASLDGLMANSNLSLALRPPTHADSQLPRLPYEATHVERLRQLVLADDGGMPLRVLQLQHQAQPPDRYSRVQWLVLLVSLLPALVIYLLLMRLVAQPLSRGVRSLRAMERQQQHRAVASPSVLQEFRQLARIFNGLLRRLSQQQEKLTALSRRDPLTGLMNAQAMQLFIAQEWRRSCRYRRGLAQILVEIKPLTCCSEAANSDEAAVVMARVLRSFSRRGGELAGRDSNGLFSLVLAEVDQPQLEALLERLWQRSAELSPFDRCPASLQIAIGAALIPAGHDITKQGLTQSDWLEQANNALYQCKQPGVGGWRLWSADSDSNPLE